jgi:hypothetical protein
MRLIGRSILWWSCCFAGPLIAQSVNPEIDPSEKAGERPYEMVWANRVEAPPPTIRFDRLAGWTMRVEGGAEATLQVTRAQDLWNRPVSRLRYKGDGKAESKPRIFLRPPEPVLLPADADSLDVWLYGNRWSWENPPGTPPVRVIFHFLDSQAGARELDLDQVRWQEWWLIHKKLPKDWPTPLRLQSIEASGGWQPEWRDIFFDSVRFFRENLEPLSFAPRARRNLNLFEGQSAGVNTGAGKLPFPTREETILPIQLQPGSINHVRMLGDDSDPTFEFAYEGSDCAIVYRFSARAGISSLKAEVNGRAVGTILDGAQVQTVDRATNAWKSFHADKDQVSLEYADGTGLRLQIWQKSLVLDVTNRTGRAMDLKVGQLSGLVQPRTIWIPYLNFGGGPHPSVLLSLAGSEPVFTSIWLDWYRSNGAELYAAESTSTNSARINGGVRYLPRTDGWRNPMFERLFITVSPIFEEVLPSVPNPAGLHAAEAADCLWQETWGPGDYDNQMKRSRMLRAYGIDKLIQCNHEIAWRDGGESFTLRLRAAPKKGGDEALRRYVAHQRGLGWFEGLYSNYTDFAPVNEFWSPDGVQRQPDGNWRTAWARCYAEKPLKAVEFDAQLAPQLKAKFNPNSAYTDVHTAVPPWGYNDYDARVPGAGTFAQTFYAYGELLRNDSRVYGGPIFSEGTYQWLYAGLADGNYGLAYDGRPLAKEPLLPVFDLQQIHTKECDIGMGWTANFCEAIPDWRKPENLDRAIDRFLLHTLAYGHIGWLVEEEHGMARTCRSYYMLQQVQARYGLKAPARIAYWDGTNLVSVSKALVQDLPRTRRQLCVEYPGGLQLWLNDDPVENWTVPGFPGSPASVVLPPSGWAAFTPDGSLASYSGLRNNQRVDYLRSPAYVYLDGRGAWFDAPEAASNGALAIRPLEGNRLELIRISGSGDLLIRRPFQVHDRLLECQAFDQEGQALPRPAFQETPDGIRIDPKPKELRYLLRFG